MAGHGTHHHGAPEREWDVGLTPPPGFTYIPGDQKQPGPVDAMVHLRYQDAYRDDLEAFSDPFWMMPTA